MQDAIVRLIMIPHLKKLSAEEARAAGFDPADPPLTPQAMMEAMDLCHNLHRVFGEPDILFHSLQLRAQQTASPAIQRFGLLHTGGRLVVGLNSLGQPDSGEKLPSGEILSYGPKTTDPEWHEWTRMSIEFIDIICRNARGAQSLVTAWVYTHRPHTAATRWIAQCNDRHPAIDELDTFDPSLLPYCIFDLMPGNRLVENTHIYR